MNRQMTKLSITVRGRKVERIGFIGLGVMGEPMCEHLIARSGLTVHGADKSERPFERLMQLGMIRNETPKAVAEATDIAVICVASASQLNEVCLGEEGLLCAEHLPAAIIDCGTTSLSKTREYAEIFAARGTVWIDAPVARGRDAARIGNLAVMAGAEEDVFAEVAPLLKCFGPDVVLCGPCGSGQVVKILNNKVVIQTVHALTEALRTAEALGVDGKTLFDLMSASSGDSRTLRDQGYRALLPGQFPKSAFPTSYARKDIALAEELIGMAGLEGAFIGTTASVLDRTADAGFADDYYPILSRHLDKA